MRVRKLDWQPDRRPDNTERVAVHLIHSNQQLVRLKSCVKFMCIHRRYSIRFQFAPTPREKVIVVLIRVQIAELLKQALMQ